MLTRTVEVSGALVLWFKQYPVGSQVPILVPVSFQKVPYHTIARFMSRSLNKTIYNKFYKIIMQKITVSLELILYHAVLFLEVSISRMMCQG